MTYEQVIESVRTVPQERLEELNEYIVHWAENGHTNGNRRHEAYTALQQFRGIVHREVDYKKELAEALDERFAGTN